MEIADNKRHCESYFCSLVVGQIDVFQSISSKSIMILEFFGVNCWCLTPAILNINFEASVDGLFLCLSDMYTTSLIPACIK